MSAKLLTDRFVANAKPGRDDAGKPIRAEYSDAACPGLRLIVQPTGSRSWALRYRRPDGRTAKKTFDGKLSLAAARAAASAARLELERGTDPAPPRLPIAAAYAVDGSEVIEVAAVQFLELHSKKIRPKTLEQYEGILRNRIIPAWRGRSITSIRRRDAIALVEQIAVTVPTLANRTVAVGSKFYAWLIARDMVDSNPFTGVERPHQEQPRRNVIPDDALRALWIAGGELIVPLSTQAIEVLDALPRRCDFVFTADGRRPVSGWGCAKTSISTKAGIDAGSWRLHDLRRTCASGMQKLGTAVHVIEKALNHMSGSFTGIVGVYQT